MKIANVVPQPDWTLLVTTGDGRRGQFDVRPYLVFEAFEPLSQTDELMKVRQAAASARLILDAGDADGA